MISLAGEKQSCHFCPKRCQCYFKIDIFQNMFKADSLNKSSCLSAICLYFLHFHGHRCLVCEHEEFYGAMKLSMFTNQASMGMISVKSKMILLGPLRGGQE